MWNRYIFVKITVPADILRLGICLASPRSTPSVYKYTLEIRARVLASFLLDTEHRKDRPKRYTNQTELWLQVFNSSNINYTLHHLNQIN